MTDHLSRSWVRRDLIDLVHSSNDVTLGELMRELNQQPLRRDLFRRGLLNPGGAALGQWMSKLRPTSLGRPSELAPVVAPSGGIGLDPALREPLVSALDDGQLGIDGILSTHTHWAFVNAVTAMSLLVATGYASFLHPAGMTTGTFAASRRLNEVLIAENRTGTDRSTLASPALGSAVEADPMEMKLISDLWSGAAVDPDELTSARLHALQAAGRVVRDGYEFVHDPAEAERIVRQRVEAAIEKNHDLFVTLGISE